MKKIVVLLVLTVALAATAAETMLSVTLKSNNNLVGAKRTPHKKLSAEQVALKNNIAWILYDWKAYSETLPPQDAKKWENKKLTPGSIKTRENSLRINHRYSVVSTRDAAGKKIVVVEEKIKTSNNYYQLTLEKLAKGWVVIKTEEAKK